MLIENDSKESTHTITERTVRHRLDVLHVTQPTEAGVANCIDSIIQSQIIAGLKVGIACPPNESFTNRLREHGCFIYRWQASRKPHKGIIKESLTLNRIISETNPNVVHLHSSKAGLIGRLVLRKSRLTIFQPNGWSFHVGGRILRSILRKYEILAAKYWTDKIISVSTGESREIKSHLKPDKISVIPNGICLKKWDRNNYTKREARKLLRLPNDAKIAVVVSRVSYQKAPDLLLAAWPDIKSQVPNSMLVWAGDGPLLNEMRMLSASDPSVLFIGPTDNPRLFFTAGDVTVLPSRWEGHSISMLESLATGRPIVCTDVNGAEDTITNGCGTVIPKNNKLKLIASVTNFLLQSEQQLHEHSKACKIKVAKHFDTKITQKLMHDLYNELINSKLPHSKVCCAKKTTKQHSVE
jgi:glycosyltransferase involved in cell wall biosynthesis